MSYLDNADLSSAQLKALADERTRTLVAAGAGSGKTKLLVSYFVRAVLDEGIPLEQLAAVTFTRKAGSELTKRIREEFIEHGHPEWARSLDRAAIGTIHGLCSRLLRQRPLEAGVDPSFAILEDDAASLLRQEIARQAWDQVIADAGEDELEAVALRGDGLREQATALYERLRGTGHDVPQIKIESDVSESVARQVLLGACTRALTEVSAGCSRSAKLDEDLAKIGDCVSWLERLAAGAERPSIAATNQFFPSRVTKGAQPWFEEVRQALARYRCALAEEELRPVAAVMNRLLSAFHERYTAFKQSRGALDFADLEAHATKMLAPGRPQAPAGPIRFELPALVSRLLVDEFQDTNEVQCAILDALGAQRVFMVGDERQSIYGFRGADVDVIRRRKHATGIGQHRLDTNYRSRPEILDFVNRLFSSERFFGPATFEPLLTGRDLVKYPPVGRDPDTESDGRSWITEVLVVDRPEAVEGDEDSPAFHEAEARAVATRIQRLVDQEGFSQGQVVVLLPVLTNVNLFQEALLAQGLKIYVVRGKGYYSQDEVADVAALLRLLINPHDDLSLVTVLRSPLAGVSDDCLYLLGRNARRSRAGSLWEVVRDGRFEHIQEDDRDRLAAFLATLAHLRTRVGRPGLSRLIDEALTACDYDLCLLAAPEGKRRFANIRKLMRMAADYEELEGPDLAGFVRLIGSLNELGDTEGNAPSLAEGEDVVRIMTIHQAKGLEFPAVFLAGLGSPVKKGNVDEFLIGHDGRMAALVKQRNQTYEDYHPHWGPAPDIMADQERRADEEDVRLQYVAMTRARDRLFLVGARPTNNKVEASARIGRVVAGLGLSEFPDPGAAIPLDDVHAAVVGVPYATDKTPVRQPPADAGRFDVAPEPACFLEFETPGPISRQLSFSALSAYSRCPRRFYFERMLGLGAVFAASGAEDDGSPASAEESTLDDIERASGRDVGILVHALLERIDIAGSKPDVVTLFRQAEAEAAGAGLVLSAGCIQRAAELTAAFWESPLAGDPELAEALREEAFFFVHHGISIHGVMDLLCKGVYGWRITDYKSNSLEGRTPATAAEAYGMQADVYCLAALQAGAPAVRMEFLFLERPEEPVVFEYRREDRTRLEERLDLALAGIEQGVFPARAGAACHDCGVERLCRAATERGNDHEGEGEPGDGRLV